VLILLQGSQGNKKNIESRKNGNIIYNTNKFYINRLYIFILIKLFKKIINLNQITNFLVFIKCIFTINNL